MSTFSKPLPLQINIGNCAYQAMIGVGGIGSGAFFALSGDHTLGREESRGGRFMDRRDYCKLHIISHYVKTLLGPEFVTIPIGQVGDDEVGHRLLNEMEAAGLDMQYVKCSPGDQTLFSFCFVYPDGSGGNLTTDDSACARVDAAFVAQAEPEFARLAGRGIALAAPEVPLEARQKLLHLGTDYRFFRVASFVAEEMSSVVEMGMLRHVDLLALNVDEAAAMAGLTSEAGLGPVPTVEIVQAAVGKVWEINPAILISITAGKTGSWSWDGESLSHVPAFQTEVISTAGAGDAHLAGIIAGLVAGLTMPQAQELGTLTAALSVTSPHTINKEVDRKSMRAFAARIKAPLCDAVKSLVKD
ncbi:MAG: carbohydrate kinase family protein [Anaerolineales bacterium]|nr:MAG: carbohydrate kinase family protein [Anaerolineales bacterium]